MAKDKKVFFDIKSLLFSLFLCVSITWMVILFIEYFLNILGTSLCTKSACKVVALLAGRFTHAQIVLMGILYFLGLIILGILGIINFRLLPLLPAYALVGTSTELILIMRQLLEYGTFCAICVFNAIGVFITTFLVFFLFFKEAFFSVKRSLLMVLATISGFLWGFYISAINLPVLSYPMVLVVKENCSHCRKVEAFILGHDLQRKIKILNIKEVFPLFRMLNLEGIPVLIVNDGLRRIFLVGDKEILKYLKSTSKKEKVQGKLQKGKSSSLTFENFTENGLNLFEFKENEGCNNKTGVCGF